MAEFSAQRLLSTVYLGRDVQMVGGRRKTERERMRGSGGGRKDRGQRQRGDEEEKRKRESHGRIYGCIGAYHVALYAYIHAQYSTERAHLI
jgi:hypothetical protein